MPIAEKMIKMVEGSAMVKKMFEEGARLRAEHGADKVYDFSLGNPDVPPPPEFNKILSCLVVGWGHFHEVNIVLRCVGKDELNIYAVAA